MKRLKSRFFFTVKLDSSGDLAASKATRANINVFYSAVEISLNSSDVRLPASVGFSVGVGNITTEGNALSAY